MKPLVKYPATVFILLLIGYSQLFVPIFKANTLAAASIKENKGCENGKVLNVKIPEAESIFIEEEEEKEEKDERISLKKYPGDTFIFVYTHLQEKFHPQSKSYNSFHKHFAFLSLISSPYLAFRVFRL